MVFYIMELHRYCVSHRVECNDQQQ